MRINLTTISYDERSRSTALVGLCTTTKPGGASQNIQLQGKKQSKCGNFSLGAT